MTKQNVFLSSFGLFLPLFSVMMPASLLRKRTKTSPKHEKTEAIYYFIITKSKKNQIIFKKYFSVSFLICIFAMNKREDKSSANQPADLQTELTNSKQHA
ncbi:MAG: hypothetical protein IJ163_08765 [Bacteroidaceae bacterium]|nr:hypothetical protein [Bacteroidaceae bacterium]